MASAAIHRTPKISLFGRRFSYLLSASFGSESIKLPPISADAVPAAKSAIRSESDPDRLAAVFDSAAHQPAFYGDRTVYRLAVQKLARRHRRLDLVERLLERSKTDVAAPKSEGFLLRVLSLYSEAGMIDHSVRTFEAMPALGCKLSERSLCALLSAFVNNRCFDRLLEAFDRVPNEVGISPGIASYNVFLKGLALNGELDKARALLDEMPERGITPDITSYNTLLNGYLMKEDESGFEQLLKEITKKGMNPNATTFNCRILALCRKGKIFQAEELLDVMSSKGVYPSLTSFNMVIEGFSKEGKVDSAMKVFRKMDGIKRPYGTGISPNVETHTMLIKSLVQKGEFTRALELFKQCAHKKWAPPFADVKGLVNGLIMSSQVNEAKDVVARMRKAIKGDAKDAWSKIEGAFSF